MLTLRATKKDPLNAVAFSPDGSRVVAAGGGAVLWAWGLPAGGDARRVPISSWNVPWLAFVGPDRVAVPTPTAQTPAAAETFRVSDGAALGPLSVGHFVSRAAASPDGRSLAAAGSHEVSLIPVAAPDAPLWRSPFGGARRYRYAYSVGWSADGRTLAVGLMSGEVNAFDAATGASAGVLAGPGTSGVTAVAVAPDGRAVAWVAGPGLHLQSLRPAGPLVRRTLGRTHFFGVAWHPSGSFFATANTDGKVDYWDALTGERRESFDWGVGRLNAIAFDAAGDRGACCSAKGHVVVWDVDH